MLGTALMVIEIHRPELEALITERLLSGPFQTVTDLLWHALKSVPVKSEPLEPKSPPKNVIEFFHRAPRRSKDIDQEIDL
jgi:hypothetical protein